MADKQIKDLSTTLTTLADGDVAAFDRVLDGKTGKITKANLKTALGVEETFTAAEKSNLANQSGTNTGDQDISGIATNASAISTLQSEQTAQDAAIALNTAKVGITTTQSMAIQDNTDNLVDVTAEVDDNTAAIALNTAKNSYPSADAAKLGGIEDEAEVNTINTSTTGEPTGSDTVLNVVSLTQAEYDAGTPVATTFYIITS